MDSNYHKLFTKVSLFFHNIKDTISNFITLKIQKYLLSSQNSQKNNKICCKILYRGI